VSTYANIDSYLTFSYKKVHEEPHKTMKNSDNINNLL